jgi:protein involved in polysaccharide export with SLBB domain
VRIYGFLEICYVETAVKHNLILAGLFFLALAFVYPQVSQEIESADDLSPDTLLALSSPDYRVTAGDVYTLAYAAGTTPVTFRIIVDSTYRIQIANLGIINAAGKTYRQFKAEAETIVSNNYPLSGVQLVLTQPGLFRVYLAGEVNIATTRTAWALARLSSLLGGNLTAYSSNRDITVTSSSGESRTYDLFKAHRDGDMSQDPYLRPEDRVRVNRIDRVVTIGGAVERPGTYQLLPGENLQDLVERYASNLTPTADPSRMELIRHIDSESDSGDKLYLSKESIAENYPLRNLDVVTVPSIIELTPVMFVEGAVRGAEVLESAESNAANRLTVRFNQGENYASLVRQHRSWFTAISDTQNAYIIREEERIPLNINPMLYDSSYRSQYFVEHNDVLIIPFRQYFVTVAGAVALPGRYPYIPDRSWDYYVALAGGFMRERNSRESVVIKDIGGKTMKKADPITPETTITARTNAGLYYFNQYAPIVTTLLSVVTAFVSVALLVNR